MEGYKYVTQPPAAGGGRPRGPVADFENTAESQVMQHTSSLIPNHPRSSRAITKLPVYDVQLGVIPRAVNALFSALKRDSSTRRCVVR